MKRGHKKLNRIFLIGSLFLALGILWVWRFSFSKQETPLAKESGQRERNSEVPSLAISKENVPVAGSKQFLSPLVEQWLAKNTRDPAVLNQGYTDIERARGRRYILAEIILPKGKLRIGELDHRRAFVRSLEYRSPDETQEISSNNLKIDYPKRNSSIGGYLFDARDAEITRVGFIVPVVADPNPNGGQPLGGEDTVVSMRFKFEYLSDEIKAKAKEVKLDANSIILPSPKDGQTPESVRVVWFKITDGGFFLDADSNR